MRPTPGWPIPLGNDVRSWVSGFVGQTGQLATADEKGAAVVEIVTKCEARDAATVKALTSKTIWQRVFG